MAASEKRIDVGFIGLGEIGAPMARRIMDAGWPLTLYARRPQTLEPFRDTPAVIAGSLRELGERADVVGICVYDDRQVEDVVLGNDTDNSAGSSTGRSEGRSASDSLLAGMRRDAIILVHSTASRKSCARIAAAAAPRGITVLDAPISGGPDGARAGTLAVMVGGDAQAFERCRPVLESFARIVRLLGPLGSGQAAKTINNALYAAQGKLVHEAVALGEALGLDRRALIDMLQASSSDSFVLKRFAVTASLEYWTKQRGTATGSVVDVLGKDAGLYLNLEETAGQPPGDVGRLAHAFAQALRALDAET